MKNFILQSMGGKKSAEKNKLEEAGSQFHDITSRYQPAYQI